MLLQFLFIIRFCVLDMQAFPEELFSVLRTVHLLRGLSVGLGINYSCAEQWRPIAEEALYLAGRLKGDFLNRS
jgi:aarF domain-containing kinase